MLRKLIPAVAALVLLIALWPNATSLYDLTGEETLPGQLRGTVHWLLTAVRPQPDQAPGAEIVQTDLGPFGMNTFLQQEVRPVLNIVEFLQKIIHTTRIMIYKKQMVLLHQVEDLHIQF